MIEPEKWVLDVTLGDGKLAFCPYKDDGTVITGLLIMAGQCPGILRGIYHNDGVEAAQKWADEHPNWRSDYGPSSSS